MEKKKCAYTNLKLLFTTKTIDFESRSTIISEREGFIKRGLNAPGRHNILDLYISNNTVLKHLKQKLSYL